MTAPLHVEPHQRSAAKVAAVATFISVAMVIYANFGLRGSVFAGDDVAATIQRIAATPLYRLSVALDVAYGVSVVALLAALYVVLRPAGPVLALLAALWKLVYAGTAVLRALALLALVRLAGDPAYGRALDAEPLGALVRLTMGGAWDQYYVGLAFWALSSTLLGWLWLRSRYVPAALAVFGIAASAWCALCSFAYLAAPGFARVVNLWAFDLPMLFFELGVAGWLLVRGLPRPSPRT